MMRLPIYVVYPASFDQIRNGSNILIDNVINTMRLRMLQDPFINETAIISFVAYNNEVINFKNFEGLDTCQIPQVENKSSAIFTDYVLNFLKQDIIKNKQNFISRKWRTPLVVFIMDYEQKVSLTSASADWVEGCSDTSYNAFVESLPKVLEESTQKRSLPTEPYTTMFIVNLKNENISTKLPLYTKICRGNIVPFEEDKNILSFL